MSKRQTSLCRHNPIVPNSTPRRGQIMQSTPPPPLPPQLHPLRNIVGSNNVPLELADLAGGPSADIDTFEDEFLRLLPTHVDSDDSKILDGDGLLDTTNQTPTPSRPLALPLTGGQDTPSFSRPLLGLPRQCRTF